ncbi:hypothetical protein Glove_21g326 [Diversispora epigaea]|uniref:Uncharacterized protein n=1 Tax=Diversispora epigaea TaxID=1348612 RepID=A0A397JUW1_9GLOM|nr:hypothetical protein Glove_21g326 [Diversispora epigaea]
MLLIISKLVVDNKLLDQTKRYDIYIEFIGNPKFNIPDFEAIAKIAYDFNNRQNFWCKAHRQAENSHMLAKWLETLHEIKNKLDAGGVTKDLIRVSVGFEHIGDIKADFAYTFDEVRESQKQNKIGNEEMYKKTIYYIRNSH